VKIQVIAGAAAVAEAGADFLADRARATVEMRGVFTLAISGRRSPLMMLDVPWRHAKVVQVDERVAPAGSPDRNIEIARRPCSLTRRWRPETSTPCRWEQGPRNRQRERTKR
jgi:6-phosphogluconolactonase/glucosamine-6-phosphate isomerase/deaminase